MNSIPESVGAYRLLRYLGESELFRFYECALPEEKLGILKITTAREHNHLLDREALILRTVQKEAGRLEEEYVPHRRFPEERLNYPIFFPKIVETFICEEQGDRRVTVMDVSASAKKAKDVLPLSALIVKYEVRVDPRTSAWMMGKMLKLLTFTHSVGISVGEGGISLDTLTVNCDRHYVLLLDWTDAEMPLGGVPPHVASREIGEAAQAVIAVLGGSFEESTIPEDPQLSDNRYAKLLFSLANYEHEDAGRAHGEFYRLVDDVWPEGGFHKFRAYSLLNGSVKFGE